MDLEPFVSDIGVMKTFSNYSADYKDMKTFDYKNNSSFNGSAFLKNDGKIELRLTSEPRIVVIT